MEQQIRTNNSDVLFDTVVEEIRELYYTVSEKEFTMIQSTLFALLAGAIPQ